MADVGRVDVWMLIAVIAVTTIGPSWIVVAVYAGESRMGMVVVCLQCCVVVVVVLGLIGVLVVVAMDSFGWLLPD